MSKPKFLSFQGASPKKAILIAVLGVVLVGVLIYQFGGAAPPKPNRKPSPAAQSPPAATVVAPTPRRPQPSIKRRPATPAIAVIVPPAPSTPAVIEPPQPEREKVVTASATTEQATPLQATLAHDPFQEPTWLRPIDKIDATFPGGVADTNYKPKEESVSVEDTLAELRSNGVSVIMIHDGQRWAKIGDRRVHVGDQIGDLTVEAINMDGVVFIESGKN
ncbi:MAG: hypothetical protein NXI22_07270 [bacterium]|nr:hypothetical protein [bacterium]